MRGKTGKRSRGSRGTKRSRRGESLWRRAGTCGFSGRGRLRCKADLGRFALGGRGDFKELARLEAKHVGENVGGELLDFGVQVADDGVVVAPRVLHGIFNLRERILQ